MTNDQIGILPDETRPEGGYAIVLLRYLTTVPEELEFSISALVDDTDDPDCEPEWSLAGLRPIGANMTPGGLAVQIGPDVVDAPELQPGTPVSLKFPAVGIVAELSWPDLPLSIPQKLAAPVVDASEFRLQETQGTEGADETSLGAAWVATADEALQGTEPVMFDESAGRLGAQLGEALSDVEPAVDDDATALSAKLVAAADEALSGRQFSGPDGEVVSTAQPVEGGEERLSYGEHGDAEVVHETTLDARLVAAASEAMLGAEPVAGDGATKATSTSTPVEASSYTALEMPSKQPVSPLLPAPGDAEMGTSPLLAAPRPLSLKPPHTLDVGREGSIAMSPRGDDAAFSGAPLSVEVERNWLSLLLGIIAIPAVLMAIWTTISAGTTQPGANAALAHRASSDWVTRIFAVNDTSPSGVDATKMTANEVLKKAENAIFERGSDPNLAERKYWLRKSISSLLAEPGSRWAVTQLGALHTASEGERGQPDYITAKVLWELASASGDTVAKCFLSQLYELGLGVFADKEKAEQWYRRAQADGGCNIRQERPASAFMNNAAKP